NYMQITPGVDGSGIASIQGGGGVSVLNLNNVLYLASSQEVLPTHAYTASIGRINYSGGTYKDIVAQNFYVQGYDDGTRLLIQHSGISGSASFNATKGAGPQCPIVFQMNGVDAFKITQSAVFPNDSTKFFDGTGTWSTPSVSGSSAISSSYAATASVLLGSIVSASYSLSSSYSISSSYAPYLHYTVSIANTSTQSLLVLPNDTNNGLFINYVLTNGTSLRAGNLMVIYTSASVDFNEMVTKDLGSSTDGIAIVADLSASSVRVNAQNSLTGAYTIVYHYDSM